MKRVEHIFASPQSVQQHIRIGIHNSHESPFVGLHMNYEEPLRTEYEERDTRTLRIGKHAAPYL
jgi:hypothetical protein